MFPVAGLGPATGRRQGPNMNYRRNGWEHDERFMALVRQINQISRPDGISSSHGRMLS
jgi:hypothetical protein